MHTVAEVRVVTAAEARTYISSHSPRLRRALRSRHVASLTDAMLAGEFPPSTPLYFAKTAQSLELIDGQHRLQAQIGADLAVEYAVVTIDCPDASAVARLCLQIDLGAKRTMSDRMRVLDIGTRVGLPKKHAQLLFNGAPYLRYRFGKMTSQQASEMSPLQRLEIIADYVQGARLFFAHMQAADKRIQKVFLRPVFVALGAYLFQHAAEQAARLWSALATSTFDGPTDPRYHMCEFPAYRSHSVVGVMAPLDCRHKGATTFPA